MGDADQKMSMPAAQADHGVSVGFFSDLLPLKQNIAGILNRMSKPAMPKMFVPLFAPLGIRRPLSKTGRGIV